MESIFSLPYSEYETIIQVQKLLKKRDGYSFYIPSSRQQKGIDLIIHNYKSNKFLRVQVKSSRSYINKFARKNDNKFRFSLWFNNFIERYNDDIADIYILFGLFPVYDSKYKIKSKNKFWSTILLVFTDKEMKKLLKLALTKKEKRADSFYGFCFDDSDKIFAGRGFEKKIDYSKYLLQNRIELIKSFLE